LFSDFGIQVPCLPGNSPHLHNCRQYTYAGRLFPLDNRHPSAADFDEITRRSVIIHAFVGKMPPLDHEVFGIQEYTAHYQYK
jgi:hypothetical protein